MRRLIYVPIIHTEPDMGRLVEGIEERAKAVVGGTRWEQHKEVVRLYWQEIARYWEGKDVTGCKLFQDGMPIDGAVGEKIVKSLADEGSINHKILEQLMQRGARLVKTENPDLLKEEYALTKELVQRKSLLGSLDALLRYRRRKDSLLKARDTYIIKQIKEGLDEGETGICFLGAYHQILPYLPPDIEIIALKDPKKVRAYYQKLTSNGSEEEIDTLGRYLSVPIQIEVDRQNEQDEQ